MRTFISYSINDTDQYLLTLLSSELYKKGVTITQSNDFHLEMSSLTKVNINKSNLFIGIITGQGQERDRVLKEWQLANVSNVPSILMIENTVPIDPNFKSPYIIFDRNYPQNAINLLHQKITELKKEIDKNPNALAWILGGAALLSIFGLLSSDD
ncbi:hypothetical protein [Winogradskyella luteola]|uniref:TIR domain-containing protein n=1 Tax=Winogradskyella luteola TaxID=2828330 RepID=A0A9X1JQ91_9FLAO|nr:hypothetical protein [Winogradskyella luteola]MBV7269574.1 hypothetical protein [Winogradskyella luteola]